MRSMTAYAQVWKRKDAQTLQLILRSLNFKYLDITVHNLPLENILLEEKIKKQIRKKIYRGKIEVYVFLKRAQATRVHLNENILKGYIWQTKHLAKKYNLRYAAKITDFLNLPQIVWVEERQATLEKVILEALHEGIEKLLKFKRNAGEAIKKEMVSNLNKLKENILKIKRLYQRRKPELNVSQGPEKEDISEEIALSVFYIQSLKNKIDAKREKLQGRAIDFLTQEILRELNTASSKTTDKKFASLIMEAKNYVDRIREQAQNIE